MTPNDLISKNQYWNSIKDQEKNDITWGILPKGVERKKERLFGNGRLIIAAPRKKVIAF
jgi:hypothetical protein